MDSDGSAQASTSHNKEPGQSRRAAYSGQWITRTFSTPERTSELLRPELEAGNITPYDFEAARAFLPSPALRGLPTLASATLAGLTGAWGAIRRRWTLPRYGLNLLFAAFVGRDVGAVLQVALQAKFIKTLQNPEGFSAALQNIYTQSIEQSQSSKSRTGSESIPENLPKIFEDEPVKDGWQMPSTSVPSESNADGDAPVPRPLSASRWDDIRSANKKPTQAPSAWDAIRESSLKEGLQRRPEQEARSKTEESHGDWESQDLERAREQAKFDALLDAERNIGSRGGRD
ncbi:hypothetical protein SISNIDRAFT_485950 [Sistotremastrum niveocremeum HHB9708]|uniref:Uncharacterized protein n=2 Tax=Sistotremastraceae TaxID=3402574 RepID=A0A164U896_9AGAM|nr:hypothetical protein SISNIDRAFT_485950 [Sistotremastrum niveocremeum HHB9708]KZT44321.1 hypothetical protein SISSUDRAFT_1123864 [Sistotremastrum suecicum HHB10207 ss-3]